MDSEVTGGRSTIHVLDLKTNEQKVVYEVKDSEPLTVIAPTLYEDYIAWIRINSKGVPEVTLRNLQTDKTGQVSICL
ncbi:MAG: hypothetical protein K6T91_11340 [Firmicutes bacterium]|nr:hypothetical protein [Bacillota bacterium]